MTTMNDTTSNSQLDTVISITDDARERIVELLNQEDVTEPIGLGLAITGVGPQGFTYETAFVHMSDVATTHVIEQHGELPVAIAPGSVDRLRGAELDMSRDLLNPGLVLKNPNTPSPVMGDFDPSSLTGSVAERASQVLTEQINPAIQSHGGWAELVAIEGSTAYLRLGGGCQGCGMAAVTLRQGIETALKGAVPEILDIVDVTDHASGTNPYYEAATK